ncbi:16297_t:CDS:2 [Dentiscutata erythropus]|uniref:16297_t:CDS:1 n=1 Tax=Dentiscutata erythropus TaxID=1348616 RepID=A0A9N8ZTZ0_9GLOM|nr:16297_t:CDS:2 [Dentiscutata erythropus]
MELTNQEDMVNELYNSNTEDKLDVSIENEDEENDENDSGWNDMESEIKELNLAWKNDSQFEKTKQGPYMKSKTPKSTYYDKYRPTGIFTKAAVGTKKITSFFTSSQPLDPNNLEEISDDSDSEPNSYTFMINRKANDLKKQLEQNHNKLMVKEYNYKRAIFEYFILLSKNNGHGKIKASLDVARKVFIDGNVWKAQKIRYLMKYWLLNDKLPLSRHGKHQKTIKIIDDEDIGDKCHIWIRSQNFKDL